MSNNVESISDKAKIEVCKKVKSRCKRNVVGALYSDTKGCSLLFQEKRNGDRLNRRCMSLSANIKLQ